MLETKRLMENEAKTMLDLIIRELVVNFGKNLSDADSLINKSDVYNSLLQDPLGLHDSPHKWALIVLTENEDVEALEKFYTKH